MPEPKKRGRGRRSLITPELVHKFGQLIGNSTPKKTACQALGVEEATFYNWLTRGEREGKGIYFELLESVSKAEALGKITLLGHIQQAAVKDWKAAHVLLKLLHPKEFSEAATAAAIENHVTVNNSVEARIVCNFPAVLGQRPARPRRLDAHAKPEASAEEP